MYLTNVTRLDMGSGYGQPLLPSAVPVEVVEERLQWLLDNDHDLPRCLGAAPELAAWTPAQGAGHAAHPAGLGWEALPGAAKPAATSPQA